MQKILEDIGRLVGTRANYQELCTKLDGQKKILSNNADKADQCLAQLDAKRHTAGYAYILHAKTQIEIKNLNLFHTQCSALLDTGDDEQLGLVAKQFSGICLKYAETLLATDTPISGARRLREAVRKVTAGNTHLLTPVHTAFALICLKSSLYDYALPVLDVSIFRVDPEATGLDALQFLSYFVYAGMIYTGVQRYANAIEMFKQALNITTTQLSIVQLAAFKKLILVSLISEGKMPAFDNLAALSGGASGNFTKLKALSAGYQALGEAYKFDSQGLDKVAMTYGETFKEDINWGLVRQVLKAHKRRSIRKLTDTYVTLSLADMANRAGLRDAASAEAYILGMVQDGEIYATMDQKNGMITFQDDPENFDTRQMVDTLDSKVQEIMQLTGELQAVNKAVVTHKKHVERTMPKTDNEEAKTDPALREALERSKRDQ